MGLLCEILRPSRIKAELLQNEQPAILRPLFLDLSIRNAKDADAAAIHFLPRRVQSVATAGVGPAAAPQHGHKVAIPISFSTVISRSGNAERQPRSLACDTSNPMSFVVPWFT